MLNGTSHHLLLLKICQCSARYSHISLLKRWLTRFSWLQYFLCVNYTRMSLLIISPTNFICLVQNINLSLVVTPIVLKTSRFFTYTVPWIRSIQRYDYQIKSLCQFCYIRNDIAIYHIYFFLEIFSYQLITFRFSGIQRLIFLCLFRNLIFRRLIKHCICAGGKIDSRSECEIWRLISISSLVSYIYLNLNKPKIYINPSSPFHLWIT